MHAEFADQGIERHHLRGVIRRHLHGFLRGQNVELAGIENEAAVGPRRDRLPEFIDLVAAAAVDIDHAGVALGAVADEAVGILAGEIDAQRHAVDEIGVVAIDQPLQVMQRIEFVRCKDGIAGAKADLAEPRSLAQQHRKRLRTDLGIERTVVTGADHVEPPRAVRDHAGEHIEPPGRAFRIGGGDDLLRQREALQQRHDVDAVGLQHRAVGQIDFVQLQFVDAFGHRRARPRQEAGAHPIGDVAETQIEARRLDLAFDKRIGRQNKAGVRHRRDHAIGQNAIGVGLKRKRHGDGPRDDFAMPSRR